MAKESKPTSTASSGSGATAAPSITDALRAALDSCGSPLTDETRPALLGDIRGLARRLSRTLPALENGQHYKAVRSLMLSLNAAVG